MIHWQWNARKRSTTYVTVKNDSPNDFRLILTNTFSAVVIAINDRV